MQLAPERDFAISPYLPSRSFVLGDSLGTCATHRLLFPGHCLSPDGYIRVLSLTSWPGFNSKATSPQSNYPSEFANMVSPPQKHCIRCKEEATKSCGRCKNIKYCSLECQQADWSTHKVLCNTFKNFADRPLWSSVRIVAFLPGEANSRFAWATVVHAGTHKTIDCSSLFPAKCRYFTALRFHHNAWTDVELQHNFMADKKLGYETQVFVLERAEEYFPDTNKAVRTATQNLDKFDFHGPIFAFCGLLGKFMNPPEFQHLITQPQDMDMVTYAHLAAYLTCFKNNSHGIMKGPKVSCIKVACTGDSGNNIPSHEVVSVPRSHPIFLGQGVSSGVSEVSLPLDLHHNRNRQTRYADSVFQAYLHAATHLEVYWS